jgi:hypothetical protein
MAAHDVAVELFYDAQWNEAPAYTRDPVTIGHGRRDEQGQAPPSSCTVTLDNRTGAYNPRNAESDLFGKIGRNTPIRVTVDGDVRFAGEVGQWQPGRAVDARDAWVKLTCNGVSRRLGQGASPAPSAPRTFLLSGDPSAYWPLEEGPLAVEAVAAAGAGGGPVKLVGRPAPSVWGQGALASWLPKVAKIEPKDAGSTLQAAVSQPDFVDTWAFDFMRSGGYGATAGNTVFGIRWGGSSVEADLESTGITFDAADSEIDLTVGFSTLATEAVDASLWDDNPHHVRLTATQDGANIDYEVFIDGVSVLTVTDTGETLEQAQSAQATVSITTETAMATGHWAVYTDPPNLAAAVAAAFGYPGEAAGRRIEALCDEQGVAFTSTGDLDDTAAVGPQHADPFLTIVQEAAGVDLGILVDDLDALGLHYRTRASIQNQTPTLELDFAAGHLAPPLDVAVDDQLVRNDVTATRRGGGEFRVVDQDGPLGIDAIGRYDDDVTVNVPGDGFLAYQAGWRLHLGTVDDDRWPRVAVDLDAAPGLADDVDAVRVGDLITVDNLPPTIAGADLAQLLVQGWTEHIGSHRRLITFTCTPAAPWQVAVYGDTIGADPSKYDTASTIRPLNYSAITTTQTLITFETLIGPPWTEDDDQFPFDVIVGGEVMTVTDIAGTAFGPLEQSFTVVRSVNGVVKGHPIGTPLRLLHTPRYGL